MTLCIDGRPRLVESLDRPNAQLFARYLQGWSPRDLGLERIEWVPDGKPIPMGTRGWVPVRRTSAVMVALSGGSHPEVDFDRCEGLLCDDSFDDERGLAVLGLDEGTPVLLADISFGRSRVYWHITFGTAAGETWEFTRAQYAAAIRDLLTLLGEDPVLISDEEWAAPPVTRVVPA